LFGAQALLCRQVGWLGRTTAEAVGWALVGTAQASAKIPQATIMSCPWEAATPHHLVPPACGLQVPQEEEVSADAAQLLGTKHKAQPAPPLSQVPINLTKGQTIDTIFTHDKENAILYC